MLGTHRASRSAIILLGLVVAGAGTIYFRSGSAAPPRPDLSTLHYAERRTTDTSGLATLLNAMSPWSRAASPIRARPPSG